MCHGARIGKFATTTKTTTANISKKKKKKRKTENNKTYYGGIVFFDVAVFIFSSAMNKCDFISHGRGEGWRREDNFLRKTSR